jgi:hypothetical protein
MQRIPAPAPPATPAVEQPVVQGVQVQIGEQLIEIPRTRQEMDALRARRSELSSQLTSAADRRRSLARELDNAQGAAKTGIEQRLAVLDHRMVQLETDIANTGRALTSAPAELLATTHTPSPIPGLSQDNFAVLAGTFTVLVLAPIAFGMMRLMWKRATVVPPSKESRESAQRLERIEQAVDAIAIEVERISEAQRYAARILSEGPPAAAAIGAGQAAAEPLRLPQYEALRVQRGET